MIHGMTMFFFSRDQAASRAFYERVFGASFTAFGPHWQQSPAGAATFALHGVERGDVTEDLTTLFFGFNVTDIAGVVARCRDAGGAIVRDVYDEAFGKVALVKDPEGRLLRVVQH